MDRVKERLSALKKEAEANAERADEAEAKLKALQKELSDTNEDKLNLTRRIAVIEAENERLDDKFRDAEKAHKVMAEKLQESEMRAETCDRQLKMAGRERDNWEQKYEKMKAERDRLQKEIDELVM